MNQRDSALAKASAVRIARAKLKRRVYTGDLPVRAVIEGVPWEAETMPVVVLLMSQCHWGRARALKLLRAIPMSESLTIGAMTTRQRERVIELLDVRNPMSEEEYVKRWVADRQRPVA